MSEEPKATGGGLPTPLVLLLTFVATALVVLVVWAVMPRPSPTGQGGRHYQEDFPDEERPEDRMSSVEKDLGVSDQPGEVKPPVRGE